MSLHGELKGEVEIKSDAHKFHDVVGFRPHHISNINFDKVQGCTLHEGEWGKGKSTICWNYVHDGKEKVGKQLIEDVDHKNCSITFRMLEGDLMEEYKNFIIKVQAIPKGHGQGQGSVVRWTFEYEKLHEGISHPETLLEYLLGISKDIDEHLTEAKEDHTTPTATTA